MTIAKGKEVGAEKDTIEMKHGDGKNVDITRIAIHLMQQRTAERESSLTVIKTDKLTQTSSSRSHKRYHHKSRWPHGSLLREEDVHDFSTPRADSHRCSVPQQHSGKHSCERHALPPVLAHLENCRQKKAKEGNRKRQYTRAEGSESEIERKRRKAEKELLGGENMKKYKKF